MCGAELLSNDKKGLDDRSYYTCMISYKDTVVMFREVIKFEIGTNQHLLLFNILSFMQLAYKHEMKRVGATIFKFYFCFICTEK